MLWAHLHGVVSGTWPSPLLFLLLLVLRRPLVLLLRRLLLRALLVLQLGICLLLLILLTLPLLSMNLLLLLGLRLLLRRRLCHRLLAGPLRRWRHAPYFAAGCDVERLQLPAHLFAPGGRVLVWPVVAALFLVQVRELQLEGALLNGCWPCMYAKNPAVDDVGNCRR